MTREEWPAEALRRSAEKVRTAGAGSRHDTLRAQSFALAPYVRVGALAAQAVTATLIEAAETAGLTPDRRKEAVRTITSGLDRGASNDAWFPDDPAAGASPRRATATWRGQVYSLAGGKVVGRSEVGPLPALPAAPAPTAPLRITFFGGRHELQGEVKHWSWGELVEGLQDPAPWPEEDGKDGLPLWSWAVFEDDSRARRPAGLAADGREVTRDPHIESVSVLALDYDDDPSFSLEQVRAWWGDLRYAVHTSASHMVAKGDKPAGPRGRVLLPLSRPVTEAEWPRLVAWVLESGRGIVGTAELKSPRRGYFVPSAAPGGYEWDASEVDAVLDVDALLSEREELEEQVEQAVEAVTPDEGLAASLDVRAGSVRDHLLNITRILDEDPRWVGRLRWSEFADEPEIDGRKITDELEGEIGCWMGNVYGVHPATSRLHEAVRVVCRRHAYHPVREYLDGLTWDGIERLDHWLEDWAGVEHDDGLTAPFGRKWAISAVARIYKPGCKVDTVLILKGAQGAGKSTLVSALAGDWFSDSALPIGDKDGYQQLRGVWIYELGELDSVSRRDWSTVKAFLTSRLDSYRPSYGRNKVTVPRQTVFVGTTNEATFIGDSTGSRRFWIREASNAARPDLAVKNRDQFWAEAVHRFHAGEVWWLDAEQEEARAMAAQAYDMVDPWTSVVEDWLRGRTAPASMAEVATGAVGRRLEDLNGADEKRLARILTSAGWAPKQCRVNGDKARRWARRDRRDGGGTEK